MSLTHRSLHARLGSTGMAEGHLRHALWNSFSFTPGFRLNKAGNNGLHAQMSTASQSSKFASTSGKVLMDGNTAVANVAYPLSDMAIIYPITPASSMGEMAEEWAGRGVKNVFGQPTQVTQMQSEAGAAGAVHGALAVGSLATTFTCSQGLLLMLPNMYKIAGEHLPTVFHVAARAIAGHALSIFGDHSDVMSARPTGFALLASGSPQEAMDMATIAHMSTLKTSVPFLHFFEGFRVSHEINTVDPIPWPVLNDLIDHRQVLAFRSEALNPTHPHMRGTSQGPDVYFQAVERATPYYTATPAAVVNAMEDLKAATGRQYSLFDYVGHPKAEHVLVAMGSGAVAAEAGVKRQVEHGHRVGLIKVRLYRPFSVDHFANALPESVKRISVLDRTREHGSVGEPLWLDVVGAMHSINPNVRVSGGRYGLGSKEFTPIMADAVLNNNNNSGIGSNKHFTVGIVDDVSHSSLRVGAEQDPDSLLPIGTGQAILWGFGSDGTVSASKNALKLMVEDNGQHAQGYFAIDAHKAGGLTVSHLRYGPSPIEAPYLIQAADYVGVHNSTYLFKYSADLVTKLKNGGTLVLNVPWKKMEELDIVLPAALKREIARKNLRVYAVDARKVATESGLKSKQINTVMLSAFVKLVVGDGDGGGAAGKALKERLQKQYAKKGENIVNSNLRAVDSTLEGSDALSEIDISPEMHDKWMDIVDSRGYTAPSPSTRKGDGNFVDSVVIPTINLRGNELPVSAIPPGGRVPPGTSAVEKRGVAEDIPVWIDDKCTQCNICALACPHAAIRPFLLKKGEDDAELDLGWKTLKCLGKRGYQYRLQVSPDDCTGCGLCVSVCPDMALDMQKNTGEVEEQEKAYWKHAVELTERGGVRGKRGTVLGSQHHTPLLEFPGACSGCPQPIYVKLLTQLFGESMVVANATGCSSIWGGTYPFNPYTTNEDGRGPAWANSLFEDNAEYGYGMALGVRQQRDRLLECAVALKDEATDSELVEALQAWIDGFDDRHDSLETSKKLIPLLQQRDRDDSTNTNSHMHMKELLAGRDLLPRPSQWIVGGDGWAYDIGFGGLDHVLASNEDVNILVLDSEVYSNTGGQTSKATPRGAIARFSSQGKNSAKKDLGLLSMLPGNAYVASVAVGADQKQTLKAMQEAEAYKGPSIILAYTSCDEHGLSQGNERSFDTMKSLVDCGYWPLYRYNPDKTPHMTIDSHVPDAKQLDEYLKTERRFGRLPSILGDVDAKEKLEALKGDILMRWDKLQRLKDKVEGEGEGETTTTDAHSHSQESIKPAADPNPNVNDADAEYDLPEKAGKSGIEDPLNFIPMGISYSNSNSNDETGAGSHGDDEIPVSGGPPPSVKKKRREFAAAAKDMPMYAVIHGPVCSAYRASHECQACIDACGPGNITLDEATGAAVFSGTADDCDGCARCVQVCPPLIVTHIDGIDEPETPLITIAAPRDRANDIRSGSIVTLFDSEGESMGDFPVEDTDLHGDNPLMVAIRLSREVAAKLAVVGPTVKL